MSSHSEAGQRGSEREHSTAPGSAAQRSTGRLYKMTTPEKREDVEGLTTPSFPNIVAFLRTLKGYPDQSVASAATEAADALSSLPEERQAQEGRGRINQIREVEQIAGRALGYPWFKDDQKNFPGATEADGVCIGEHVAETIVEELAARALKAEEQRKALMVAVDELRRAYEAWCIEAVENIEVLEAAGKVVAALSLCEDADQPLLKTEGEGNQEHTVSVAESGGSPTTSVKSDNPHSAGLARFARAVLRSLWEGCDLDGGEIQDLGLKHGLIRQTAFDPETHADVQGVGVVAGDEWFVEEGWLAEIAQPSEAPHSAGGGEP